MHTLGFPGSSVKLSLFSDDMALYMENPQDNIIKFLDLLISSHRLSPPLESQRAAGEGKGEAQGREVETGLAHLTSSSQTGRQKPANAGAGGGVSITTSSGP